MHSWFKSGAMRFALVLAMMFIITGATVGFAQEAQPVNPPATGELSSPTEAAPAHKSEAELTLPDLGSENFMGVNGRSLLMGGLVVCVLGLLFGFMMFTQLRNLPVHQSMREISELIYETCKTMRRSD